MVLRSLLVALCSVLVLGGCHPDPVAPVPAPALSVDPVRQERVELRALRVLHAWDARRATAYARGDVAGLRRLYTARSEAGARDARLLQEYVDRGLVVRDLGAQVLRAEVVVDRPGRLTLVVCDRVDGGRVVGRGIDRMLPADRVDCREVTLDRRQETWRVRSVGPD